MAAPTQIGLITVWGVDGTFLFTGLLATDNVMEQLDFEDTAEVTRRRDNLGETKGLLIWDPVKRISVTFVPSDPSDISDAEGNVRVPVKGATCEFAGFGANAGIISDKWIYEQGGTINYTSEGEVRITLPLTRYNTDISTASSP